jgi:hypothetical protein
MACSCGGSYWLPIGNVRLGRKWLTVFILMLPMEWEQPNTVKSVFPMIIIQSGKRVFIWNETVRKESKQTERQRERESACVCVLVDTDDSVGQHPQTSWDIETHLATIDRRHLWSISKDFWERSEMMFLMVGLMFGSDILNRRQFKKGVPFWHSANTRAHYAAELITALKSFLAHVCFCQFTSENFAHLIGKRLSKKWNKLK